MGNKVSVEQNPEGPVEDPIVPVDQEPSANNDNHGCVSVSSFALTNDEDWTIPDNLSSIGSLSPNASFNSFLCQENFDLDQTEPEQQLFPSSGSTISSEVEYTTEPGPGTSPLCLDATVEDDGQEKVETLRAYFPTVSETLLKNLAAQGFPVASLAPEPKPDINKLFESPSSDGESGTMPTALHLKGGAILYKLGSK